jgi:hypothetical protein
MSADDPTTFTGPREIEGWPGYRVWPDGLIESRRRRGAGNKTLSDHWRVLIPRFQRDHLYVELQVSRKRWRVAVHVLVLTSFRGPCPEGMEACHNDGNPLNNHVSNLRWDTRKANAEDRVRHGRQLRGSAMSNAKLTEEIVKEIRNLYSSGSASKRALARMFGIGQTHVRRILDNEAWNHC